MAIAAAAAAALAAHAGLAAALRVPVAPACLEPSLLPAHADQSDERPMPIWKTTALCIGRVDRPQKA